MVPTGASDSDDLPWVILFEVGGMVFFYGTCGILQTYDS